jgi:hypothetical protein
MRRVTGVAASVLPSHVQNERLGVLRLHAQSGNERVFRLDDHVFGFGLELQPDRELLRGTS